MKGLRIIAILILILSPLFVIASSSSLIIAPPELNEDVIAGEDYSWDIQLRNTFNHSIYNISFSDVSDYVDLPFISQLNPNQTLNATITANVPNQDLYQFQSTVSFLYLLNFSQEPITHEILIKDILNYNPIFDPNLITARTGDTIKLRNVDDDAHHILAPNFDVWINPDEEYEYTIQETDDFIVTDVDWGRDLTVDVIPQEAEEYVHNSNYDVIFPITLNSLFQETQILFELLDTDFTVKNKESTEGVLQISNNGDIIARKINLSADKWITFSQNNFDVQPDATKYIIYTISPDIDNINETNKNHNIKIKAKGINTPEVIKSINVYVPYDSDLEDSPFTGMSPEELRALLEYYLSQIEFLQNQSSNQTNNNTISAEFSTEDFYNWVKNVIGQGTDINDILKRESEGLDNDDRILSWLERVEANINSTEQEMENIRKSTSNNNNLIVGIGVFTLIIIAGGKVLQEITQRDKNKKKKENIYGTKKEWKK